MSRFSPALLCEGFAGTNRRTQERADQANPCDLCDDNILLRSDGKRHHEISAACQSDVTGQRQPPPPLPPWNKADTIKRRLRCSALRALRNLSPLQLIPVSPLPTLRQPFRQSNDPMPLSTLSMNPLQIPELLSLICHHLDRQTLVATTRVSRNWYQICTPVLWEFCSFSAEQYGAYHDVFDDHAHLIRHMDTQNRLIGAEMRFIAQQCINLGSLTLRYYQVTPSSLDILCDGIPRVQHLSFELCRGINSSSIAPRLTRLPSLTHLDIIVHTQERGNGDWREDDMALMLTKCPLQYLKIVGPDLSHIHLLGVQRHASPLPLVHLHMVSTFLSENALKNLLCKSPYLSVLILLQNANKNSTVQVIAENCPNLRMLELRNSKSIATAAFDSVFKKCPLLTKLDISHTLIYDAAVIALAQNCPKLRILDLSGCARVTHTAFLELVTTLTCLQQLCVGGCTRLKIEAFSGKAPWASRQTLEVLDMSSVGIRAESDSLDELVQHLGSLTRLQHLYLDEGVSQHFAIEQFLAQSSSVSLSITQPEARPS